MPTWEDLRKADIAAGAYVSDSIWDRAFAVFGRAVVDAVNSA
jgi:hypothetical protein